MVKKRTPTIKDITKKLRRMGFQKVRPTHDDESGRMSYQQGETLKESLYRPKNISRQLLVKESTTSYSRRGRKAASTEQENGKSSTQYATKVTARVAGVRERKAAYGRRKSKK